MKPGTFIPIDYKNSEKYRSDLLLLIQKYNFNIDKNNENYEKSIQSDYTSLLMIGGIFIIIVTSINIIYKTDNPNYPDNPIYLILGLISTFLGLKWKNYNEKQADIFYQNISDLKLKIKDAYDAYNYAYTYKNKDGKLIYKEDGSFYGTKIF